MPVNAEQERRLLNHYKLTSLYPDTWPTELDQDDESDGGDDGISTTNGGPVRQTPGLAFDRRTSTAKYRNIDRHASMRSASVMGPNSVVQMDEPDPLGMAPSVVSELRRRGIPVEDDLKLRNRFMLSSTTFNPSLFLSQVHQDASMDDLLRGLENLSQSIEQKSASLKVLVESNFEKFVKAKSTIDAVYTEMKEKGGDADGGTAGSAVLSPGRKTHSRQISRSQAHFRNMSGPFSPAGAAKVNDKKKNALTKESEYGVLGIKAPLQEVTIKAEEVWGSALGAGEREEALKSVISALDTHKDIFRLASTVHEAIKNSEYDVAIEGWKKANKYADQAREIAAVAQQNAVPLADQDAHQILITAKMYHDVSTQIERLKRDTWRRLKTSHGRKPAVVSEDADKEEHMELIGVLLQLGVDENPIWEWLNSRCLYLKNKIARSFERARVEIEILRRQLALASERQDASSSAQYLRSALNTSSLLAQDDVKAMDAPAVLTFWEKVQASFNHLLGPQNGVLGEVVEFWDTTQSFIDNKTQKTFPTAVFTAGLEHLELEPDDVVNLRAGAADLVNQLRDVIMSFFVDSPVEDLSELYSPIPQTPVTPETNSASRTPTTASVTRTPTFALALDLSNVPPPTPKTGAASEKFAFWPPNSNALSGSYFLSKLLVLVGVAATELAALSITKQSRPSIDSLKHLVGAVRERCIQAVCAAWVTDAERCKYLETWQRSSERKDLTRMPSLFMAFEERVLGNCQKIAYVPEAAARSSGRTAATVATELMVPPPPAKLLQLVRQSFVASLYKTLSGMVENAEKGQTERVTEEADPDGVTMPIVGGDIAEGAAVDGSNRNFRILMTLSNLSHVRADLIPHLLTQFETAFSVKLTEETKTVHDVLSQIDARLFQAYTKPLVDRLSILIFDGINSPTWAPSPDTSGPSRPSNAKQYVYDSLLLLVLVHSEITTTTATASPSSSAAGPLLGQVLSYLLEAASQHLLTYFTSAYTHYTLPMLMQATLDVEFLAQTLNTYTTDKAGELQQQVYLVLDERTDDEARQKLQGELPEMRAVLKRLREGTKGTFGCFRRERRGREGREREKGSGGGSKGQS